jgi:hypothetical protein
MGNEHVARFDQQSQESGHIPVGRILEWCLACGEPVAREREIPNTDGDDFEFIDNPWCGRHDGGRTSSDAPLTEAQMRAVTFRPPADG